MAFESVKTQINILGTVKDVAALKAIATPGLVDGDAYVVTDEEVLVAWRPTGEIDENLAFGIVVPTDVTPPAPGRWFFLWELGVGTGAWVNHRLETRDVSDTRSGDVVDYPTGSAADIIAAFPKVDVIFMTTTLPTTIHGFDAAAAKKTDKLLVYRSGANPLNIANESTTELVATNRFIAPPGFAMVQGDAVRLSYDRTSLRWRVG